ncbi:MAG: nicotinate-nucleotide adenylyltransferase [Anaerolineales bacterium]
MTERLGIFGGTFDPPHIGHLILAAEAWYQLELDQVLWVLTPQPPHKRQQEITPLHNRLELVKAAIRDSAQFQISRAEIDRPPPHYAVDTVRLLHKRYPRAELIYLMGGDSLHDLPAWHACQEFVAACHTLGVMRRPGDEIDLSVLETQIPAITSKVRFVDAPLLEIAASQIRSRIRQGKPFRYYLPEAVFQIIQDEQLYQQAS